MFFSAAYLNHENVVAWLWVPWGPYKGTVIMYYIFMIAGTCDLESRLEEVWHLGGTFKKKKSWKLIGENDSSEFTAVPSTALELNTH